MKSLAEKIGQLMMVGFEGLSPPRHILQWLASGRIGGVYLFARNVASPTQAAGCNLALLVDAICGDCISSGKLIVEI